jgi:Membrane bound FAD containing D-sorbitol dehydrogenase
MNTNPEIKKFILLSEYLTDKKDLNEKIAGEYLNRLELQLPTDTQNLLAEIDKITSAIAEEYWEFELKRKIIENDKFSPITQQILRLWYTSQFVVVDDKTDVRTREQYNEGLLWKVVHTDAPGADKRKKYGYWKNHPVKPTK